MELRKTEIFFKDCLAGSLEETATGGSRFSYASEWKEPIACCFPIIRREHEWGQGLHPFFQQLGAEGWLRQKQARVAHVAEEDDFGLLLVYGADCIGAVSVGRVGRLSSLELDFKPLPNSGRTISGVQRKLLVFKDGDNFRASEAAGPATHIAKFNSESLSTLVRNEYLSLSWTSAVLGKSEVTEFALDTVTDDHEQALIVKRFDRTPTGKKLRLEDFAQILCKPRGRNYEGKYDAGYEEVAEVIKAHSCRPEIDLEKFFRRLIVFTLVGNCDGHLKNFSLLETQVGLRLSPLYDVVNTAYYPEHDQGLALSIDGVKELFSGVRRPLLERFGRSIGLQERAIEQVFQDLGRAVRRAEKILTPPPGEQPDGFVHRFAEIVSGACLRILEK
jgi:serine/threonine-protein kinase HipA